jgi:nicotinate-nucleotide adenylyltransferase
MKATNCSCRSLACVPYNERRSEAIGILGGTFDPIHSGHIALAQTIYENLELQKILFIPCAQSPLKNRPIASDEARLAMLHLALDDYPHFAIDNREIIREGKSYTYETLLELRSEYPTTPLCLIMSEDAFAEFDKWYHWREIITTANIIVANRPESREFPAIIIEFLKQHQTTNPKELHNHLAGKVFLQKIVPNFIAATKIRIAIKNGNDVSSYLPKSVIDFIKTTRLYE